MEKHIFVGCSGNTAAHLHISQGGGSGSKVPVSKIIHRLEGSSINATHALGRLGRHVNLALLVGRADCPERQIFGTLHSKLPKFASVFPLAVLDKCNQATVLVREGVGTEDHQIFGFKGKVLPGHLKEVFGQIDEATKGACCALLTSVRSEELPFVQRVIAGVPKRRVVMTMHRSTIDGEESILRRLLSNTDILVLNEAEYQSLHQRGFGYRTLHSEGVRLVVMTRGEQNGEFSLKGSLGAFNVDPAPEVCSVGAGDNFVAFLTSLYAEGEKGLFKSKDSCAPLLEKASVFVRHALVNSLATLPA